jgi:hypothetical protein
MPPANAFCSACGARLVADARFCHGCGSEVGSAVAAPAAAPRAPGARAINRRWVLPIGIIAAVGIVSIFAFRMQGAVTVDPEQPLAGGGMMRAPDISSMSPQERADRLFNRVMQLWSEGKPDSAAFFAPMALSALGDLRPVTAHVRYDMGLVALVGGDAARARTEADAILAERPTHLLGLSLAARAADARGDDGAARSYRQRMLAAEGQEWAAGLQEYQDHEMDLRDALSAAARQR